MPRQKFAQKVIVCIVLLTFAAGCTTNRSLQTSNPRALAASISLGDQVSIDRTDGSRLTFEVTEVTIDGLAGNGVFVPYADIENISVTRESWVRTGLLVALGIAVVFALEKNSDCGIFSWDDECDE